MSDLVSTLDAIQVCLLAGEFEQAAGQLEAFACDAVQDAALHVRVARLAEDTGRLDRAVLEYNHALRDDPRSVEALRRLAQLRTDLGQHDRAVRCLRKLLDLAPDDLAAAADLRRLLELEGKAEPLVLPWDDDPSVRSADVALVFYEADAIQLCSRFAGREGVYARQWASPSERTGYTPIHEPFTASVARKHLLGDITVGVYVVRLDQTVNFLAFDLDLARHVLGRSADPRLWQALQRTVQAAAVHIVDGCAALEIPAYIEDSGQKGRHVWVFFEPALSADAARRLARCIRDQLREPLPPEVQLEVFPKQARVGTDGLGNLIKLPLGIHRKTGRRALFLLPDGAPAPDQRQVLAELQTVPPEHVYDILSRAPVARRRAGEDDLNLPFEAEPRSPRGPDVQEAADPELPVATYDPEQDEEYLWLLERCGVLAAIARKADAEGTLSADERAVFTHTVGHLRHGAEAVNTTLRKVRGVQPAEFLKSPLRGNPMGCRRIHERAPELALEARCECRFEAAAGSPTPLLHLADLQARGTVGVSPDELSQLQLERLVNDLIRIRVESARLVRLESRLQERIRDFMRIRGLTELSTPAGTVWLGEGGTLSLSISLFPEPPAAPAAGQTDDHPVRD